MRRVKRLKEGYNPQTKTTVLSLRNTLEAAPKGVHVLELMRQDSLFPADDTVAGVAPAAPAPAPAAPAAAPAAAYSSGGGDGGARHEALQTCKEVLPL